MTILVSSTNSFTTSSATLYFFKKIFRLCSYFLFPFPNSAWMLLGKGEGVEGSISISKLQGEGAILTRINLMVLVFSRSLKSHMYSVYL